jgi:hypothetical protein
VADYRDDRGALRRENDELARELVEREHELDAARSALAQKDAALAHRRGEPAARQLPTLASRRSSPASISPMLTLGALLVGALILGIVVYVLR